MSVIVLTGGPGAPGITTTSLGLALCWPGDVMLSDCDRDPSLPDAFAASTSEAEGWPSWHACIAKPKELARN